MSDELIVRGNQEVAAVQPQESILAVIARAAKDPGVDVAKMQALLDMQERLAKNQAEIAFKADLAAIQAVAPTVLHDGKIIVKQQIRSTYATFEAIDKELRPLTAEHGFSYRFTTDQADAKTLLVIMIVSHRMGHSETATMPLPIDASEYRSAVQNVRSSISYAKRCLVSDFFNIVTAGEDNDGQGGFVTADQVNKLRDLIIGYRVDEGKFLAYMDAPSVEKIPARKFQHAIEMLNRKRT